MIRFRLTSLEFGITKRSLRLYSLNLQKPVPEIKSKVEIEVVAYDHKIDLDFLPHSTVEQRISREDQIFVAYHGSEPVAYLFATTTKCWVEEIEDWFAVKNSEVYLYDAHTIPRYRGNFIYSSLITNAANFFKKSSNSYAIIFTTASNINSVRGIERCSFQCYEKIGFCNIFGVKIWNYNSENKHVKSRFSNEI